MYCDGSWAELGRSASGSASMYHTRGLVPFSSLRWDVVSSRINVAIGDSGSETSPEMIACSGQTTTHAGSSPRSVRWAQ